MQMSQRPTSPFHVWIILHFNYLHFIGQFAVHMILKWHYLYFFCLHILYSVMYSLELVKQLFNCSNHFIVISIKHKLLIAISSYMHVQMYCFKCWTCILLSVSLWYFYGFVLTDAMQKWNCISMFGRFSLRMYLVVSSLFPYLTTSWKWKFQELN